MTTSNFKRLYLVWLTERKNQDFVQLTGHRISPQKMLVLLTINPIFQKLFQFPKLVTKGMED